MNYKLQDFIDSERINILLDLFHKTTGFLTAILDLEGNVISKSGWREICTDFHRVNPETCKKCTISDTILSKQMADGEKYHAYECLNGLVDVSVPIILDGEHVGNLFTGQFLFKEPDLDFFRNQAIEHGFDEEMYMSALKKVPIVSEKDAKVAMDFLLNMTLLFCDMTMQKNERRKSEQLYHDLVETAQDLIWQCDAEGRYTYLNPEWENVFGYKVGEMLGKKKSDFQTKEWAEHEAKEFERLLKDDIVKGLETVHLAKDGKEINLGFNAKLVHDDNGNIIGTSGTAYNITERKKTDEAIKQSESKYRELIELAVDGILQGSPEGIITDANSFALKLLGRSYEELIGNHISTLFSVEEAMKNPLRFDLLIKGEAVITKRNLTRPNGKTLSIEMHSKMMPDGSYQSILRDITKKKLTEDALRESEEKYRLSFQTSPDSVNINRMDGLYVDINEGYTNLTGYTREDVIGKTSSEIDIWAIPADREKLVTDLKENGFVRNLESTFRCKDDSLKTALMSASLIYLNNEAHIISITRDISHIKKTQEQLQKSEIRFRTAFENSTVGMSLTSTEGNFLQVNSKLCQILGYTSEELLNLSFQDITYPDDLTLSSNFIANSINEKSNTFHFEKRYIRKTGEIIWAEISSSLLKDKDAKPMYFITHIIDSTERKKAEEIIREKDAQFRKLSANLPDLIFQFTRRPDGTYFIPIASEGIVNIFGCSPEDVREDFTPIGNVIYPDDAKRVISEIEYSAEHLTYFVCEFRVQIPGKDIQWIYSRSSPEKLDDGSVTWYGFNADITELKHIEKYLRDSEERYRKLIVNLEAGVIVHAPDTSIVLNNQRASDLLGLTDDQLRSKTAVDPYWKFIDENHIPFALEDYPVNRVRTTKQPFKDLILGVARKEFKDIVWLTVSGFPVLDSNNEIEEILISFIEITKQKNATEEIVKLNAELELRVAQRTAQLEESNKELESFVYSVSHDLRAPLRSIMGFSQIISRRHIDDLNEEGIEYFSYILEASKNMADLIEDLLHFSRLAKGPFEREVTNINDILASIIHNLNKDIEQHEAKIIVQPDMPQIVGNRALVGQIFSNLISNAILYSRDEVKPEILISAVEVNNKIMISVKDNGQGIPAEHFEKIFNIFQRLHSSEEYPGTGIGLAIVKKAVKALGGDISIESEVGEGTIFYVNLPKE